MIRHPILFGIVAALTILGFATAWVMATIPARGANETCGTASFYAHQHHGRTMANGQPFNMHAMTAAMWDAPFGTRYRVTYRGKSVVVVISDRGPAKRLGRIIDLSYAAAKQLGMVSAGVGRVCLERVN